ncbi:hypothetical protein [Brevibacterium sp.]|uniref:hypothetical protein n=1 Tax=Brevibacterium sp. TaxID=1701 RepID=UPI002811A8D9|nr:hypothetical protein [Brevibacterium sp.]
MTAEAAPRPQSLARAVVAGMLAALVLAFPILWIGFAAMIAWSGCFIECGTPDRGQAVLLLILIAVLLVDIGLWAMAGLRRFPPVITLIAAGPPVILGVAWLVGTLSGAY